VICQRHQQLIEVANQQANLQLPSENAMVAHIKAWTTVLPWHVALSASRAWDSQTFCGGRRAVIPMDFNTQP
jgi:hypothetical protein